jgi:ribosome-associated protein
VRLAGTARPELSGVVAIDSEASFGVLSGDSDDDMVAPSAGDAGPVAGDALLATVREVLDDAKAENVVEIALAGKTELGDYMIVASGRSSRHVGAIADQLSRKLKGMGMRARIEGMPNCDWVLVDAGDVIVHVFRPEVRDFYNLEKMWSADNPAAVLAARPPAAG